MGSSVLVVKIDEGQVIVIVSNIVTLLICIWVAMFPPGKPLSYCRTVLSI